MRGSRGIVLFEAMVATAILAIAGGALLALVLNAADTEQRARDVESGLAAAERVLTAVSLLARADLDVRLGARDVGEFTVDVQRPERSLYRVAIAERAAPDRTLLVTVLYRPEPGAQ